MNFVDWFLTSDFVALSPIQKLFKIWLDEGGYKDVKSFQIIGTCGECGVRDNYDVCYHASAKFGCIHFEQKEKNETQA